MKVTACLRIFGADSLRKTKNISLRQMSIRLLNYYVSISIFRYYILLKIMYLCMADITGSACG